MKEYNLIKKCNNLIKNNMLIIFSMTACPEVLYIFFKSSNLTLTTKSLLFQYCKT